MLNSNFGILNVRTAQEAPVAQNDYDFTMKLNNILQLLSYIPASLNDPTAVANTIAAIVQAINEIKAQHEEQVSAIQQTQSIVMDQID